MNSVVHVIGHKNPDTDSIVASIAYAELKRALGMCAVACRIGDLNIETEYVLKRFGVDEPIFIENAKVKLYDVPFDPPLLATKDTTILLAWEKIAANGMSPLYIVDDNQHLVGVVSMSDIASILLNDKGPGNKLLMSQTGCDNLKEVLEGSFIYRNDNYYTNGDVHILGNDLSLYENNDYKDSICVCSQNIALQELVIKQQAACLILVDVVEVSDTLISLAKQYHTTIIKTDLSMLCTIRRIFKAPSVDLIMKKETICFNNHEYIDDVYKKMSKSRFRSYPVINNQGKVLGSISRYHLLNYQKKKFILVDHNELSQSIDYLKDGEVLEIVDHHRIGNVETSYPISFRNEIIGSTCSIITKMYEESNVEIDQKMASILLCAIISDTMNFKSPTTTLQDKAIAKRLADIAGLDIDALANEIVAAVATIKGREPSQILYNDFKEYDIDKYRIAIGQINICNEKEVLDIRDSFKAYLQTINNVNKFDLLMMCFTQADASGSNLMFVGKLSNLVEETFKDEVTNDLFFVKNIISRKKQIVPRLSKILND